MRAYIHGIDGRPSSGDGEAAWRGFEKLGVECTTFSDVEELVSASRADVIVGNRDVVVRALALKGVTPPEIDVTLFQRRFEGVLESESFASRWRCFIRRGQPVGTVCYHGNDELYPYWRTIREVLGSFYLKLGLWIYYHPAAYALDVGVTPFGRTALLDIVDGYALEGHGIDDVTYALLLVSRWSQLMGVPDELADVPASPSEDPITQIASTQLWHDPLYGEPGPSIPLHEPDLPRWTWGIAANVRTFPRGMAAEKCAGRRSGTKHFAAGALVWIQIPPWDWTDYERIVAIGKKKGTHRYIRKIMALNMLENFRVKRVFSPTVMSWMFGKRSEIENFGDSDTCNPHGIYMGDGPWDQDSAAQYANILRSLEKE